MSFPEWLARHRRSVLSLIGALAVGGVAALPSLPVSLFPVTSFPRVVVSVDAGDRPADRMIIEVTRPLEEALRSVPGVRNVRSNSSRGTSDISIDFDWGLDMYVAALQVESAIAGTLPQLPPGVRYEVRRMDPTVFPVMGLSLTSKFRSQIELHDLAVYDVAPLLSTIHGVARVRVLGGEVEEIQILADRARLEASGLGFQDILNAVSASNVVRAVGRLEDREKLYLILSDTRLSDLASIGDLIVRESASGSLRVRDVATVRRKAQPQWLRVVADGKDAVVLNVYQQPGGDTVRIAKDIHSRLVAIRRLASNEVGVEVWYDQSDLIRASVGSVRDAIGIGVLISVAIVGLFLRSPRITLVTSIMVPVVLGSALLFLRLLGMGLNIMTLGGLAAAVGLVIDDGVVMVEHILRRLRTATAERHRVVLQAAREMAIPLTASSAATIIIFVPLAYLTGVTGVFFKALSLTMASSLLVSYVVAYLAVPLLADHLLREKDSHVEDLTAREARWLGRYETLLRSLLQHPSRILAFVVPILIAAIFGYRWVGSEFLPTMDEGGFVLDYVAPAGTSLTETDRRLRQIEQILSKTPEVAAYSRRTGLALGGFITEANEGDYFVRLRPPPRRSTDEIMNEVRARIGRRIPGLEIEVAQLMGDLIGDLTSVPQPIEVKLSGAHPDLLRREALRVARAIRGLPGVVDVKSGVVLAGDGINIRIDREHAHALGLDPLHVTRRVQGAFEGVVATQIQQAEKMVGVRVWASASSRSRLADLKNFLVRKPNGTSVRLGRVASITRIVGEPQITRENLETMVAVTGRIAGRDLGSVMRDVRARVAKMKLSRGTRVEYGGLYREQQRSFRDLLGVLLASVALLFLLLLYLYERFAAPIAILAVAGLAAAAVFPGLLWTGAKLDISAMMGLTMIVGISSEAAIFFMTQWQESSSELPFEDALVTAGRLRLRPIVMTALAAIGALLPLALAIGEGAAMLQSMAIAIISGLVVTVPGVLIVLPVLYKLLSSRASARG